MENKGTRESCIYQVFQGHMTHACCDMENEHVDVRSDDVCYDIENAQVSEHWRRTLSIAIRTLSSIAIKCRHHRYHRTSSQLVFKKSKLTLSIELENKHVEFV